MVLFAKVTDYTDYTASLPRLPEGLADVSTYPQLFARLAERGWTEGDLKKLAGDNLIRAFKAAEEVRTLGC